MQGTIPIPHNIKDVLWLVLAIILASLGGGGGYKLIELLITRRKSKAETKLIELQTTIAGADAVSRMMSQLTFTHVANDKLYQENCRLKNEIDVYESELRWAKAIFKLKGLRWEPTKEGH